MQNIAYATTKFDMLRSLPNYLLNRCEKRNDCKESVYLFLISALGFFINIWVIFLKRLCRIKQNILLGCKKKYRGGFLKNI